jgi:P27 family predicted phage terminase small subunit
MTEDAKSKWDELIPKLERTGVLTEIDGDALAQYCTAFANWKQYEQLAARLPPVMKVGKSGYMQQAPMVAATMKASTLVARLAERLGLDPSSRSRIVVTGGTEDDAEEFLFGQKKG